MLLQQFRLGFEHSSNLVDWILFPHLPWRVSSAEPGWVQVQMANKKVQCFLSCIVLPLPQPLAVTHKANTWALTLANGHQEGAQGRGSAETELPLTRSASLVGHPLALFIRILLPGLCAKAHFLALVPEHWLLHWRTSVGGKKPREALESAGLLIKLVTTFSFWEQEKGSDIPHGHLH